MRRLKAIGVLIAAGVLAAACGTSSSSSSGSSSGPSGVLTIDNESGGTWTCDFSPFNLSYVPYSLGPVYEPLVFVNTLQSGQETPWLATSWTWSNGNKQITFTIRNGVKFSNGHPLTPADVVFTFNMLKKFKISFPTARDPEENINYRYGTYKVPESYIIDRNGKVLQKYAGLPEVNGEWKLWTDPEIVNYIRSLL